MRSRPFLTRLLVVLLLMQWGTAFGHCLRLVAPAAAFTVEICTADGVHRVALPVEEGDRHADHAAAICPACQAPGAFTLAVPEPVPTPSVVLVQSADPPPPPAPPLPLPPRSCQPRAPPTS